MQETGLLQLYRTYVLILSSGGYLRCEEIDILVGQLDLESKKHCRI